MFVGTVRGKEGCDRREKEGGGNRNPGDGRRKDAAEDVV